MKKTLQNRFAASFSFLVGVTLFSQGAIAGLSCKSTAKASFLTADGSHNIDPANHVMKGRGSRQDCQALLGAQANGYICNWNGANYQPFAIAERRFIGEKGDGFNTVEDCAASVNASGSDAICSWNGTNYNPYGLHGSRGTQGYGFDTLTECQTAAQGAHLGLACNWDGAAYTPYKAGDTAGALGISLKTLELCNKFVALVKNVPQQFVEQPSLRALEKPIATAPDDQIGFTLGKCQDPKHHYNLIKADGRHRLLAECLPDTLYAWGGFSKLQWYQENLGAKGKWAHDLPQMDYFTQSPVGSFGYGSIPIRIKLKNGIKAKLYNQTTLDFGATINCDTLLPDNEKYNSIVVRYWENESGGNGLDYMICSSDVIASWSFAQPEHFDEIVDDLLWVKNHDFKQYELYYKEGNQPRMMGTGLDSHDFSDDTLRADLVLFQQMIQAKMGGVFFSDPGSHQRLEHFTTKHPIYYNDRVAPTPARD